MAVNGIARYQRLIANSRSASVLSNRLGRFFGGAAYRRLGHDTDEKRNGEADLISALAPKISTFIDVGSNVGDWTALVLSRQPRATGVLVEPNKEAADYCRRRFQGADVLVAEAAAGAQTGTADFHELPNRNTLSSIVTNSKGAITRSVSVCTLDALASKHGWHHVDIVKVDAEGYDFQVIRGASGLLSGQHIGVVQFEYNQAWQFIGDSLREALDIFSLNQYRVFNVARGGLWLFDYADYGDFYHHSNFAAVSPRFRPLAARLIRGRA
jgi:FkbM family methyltransferase